MVREEAEQPTLPPSPPPRGLVVGNYCHDVILHDDDVVSEGLGGAASFVSNVLDGLSLACSYVSKVGTDFAYHVSHPPLSSPSSSTTLFHAHFRGHGERILRRVRACEPISPSDLPPAQFDFGLAVGVAGEITPETLAGMLDACRLVFVDVQALIRDFDPVDGTVRLVRLEETGFAHLLPRIGFLKASAVEAPYLDIEKARKWCCVVVTDGEEGCRVYCKDRELRIPPFPTVQIDPTGAGDSFLGGFVAGLVQGLPVPEAALLGNFFGSLTVGQIGVPKFNPIMFQKVKDEMERRALPERRELAEADLQKANELKELQLSLVGAAKLQCTTDHSSDDPQLDRENFLQVTGEGNRTSAKDNRSHSLPKLFLSPVYEAD